MATKTERPKLHQYKWALVDVHGEVRVLMKEKDKVVRLGVRFNKNNHPGFPFHAVHVEVKQVTNAT